MEDCYIMIAFLKGRLGTWQAIENEIEKVINRRVHRDTIRKLWKSPSSVPKLKTYEGISKLYMSLNPDLFPCSEIVSHVRVLYTRLNLTCDPQELASVCEPLMGILEYVANKDEPGVAATARYLQSQFVYGQALSAPGVERMKLCDRAINFAKCAQELFPDETRFNYIKARNIINQTTFFSESRKGTIPTPAACDEAMPRSQYFAAIDMIIGVVEGHWIILRDAIIWASFLHDENKVKLYFNKLIALSDDFKELDKKFGSLLPFSDCEGIPEFALQIMIDAVGYIQGAGAAR